MVTAVSVQQHQVAADQLLSSDSLQEIRNSHKNQNNFHDQNDRWQHSTENEDKSESNLSGCNILADAQSLRLLSAGSKDLTLGGKATNTHLNEANSLRSKANTRGDREE